MTSLLLPDDEVVNLAAARRARRIPRAVDPVERIVQAWDELYAQRQDLGEQDVPFDLDWRRLPLLKTTTDLLITLLRSGSNGNPDASALHRLLRGLGPSVWPQGRDARLMLWHTTVMTWRSANVPAMNDAQRCAIVDAFLAGGLDPNVGGAGVAAPLYTAVSQRDLPLAQHLVAHGGDVHRYHQRQARSSPDGESVGLLTLAAQRNDPAMCAWLLDLGVPVNVPHAVVPQPLAIAMENEAWDAFRVLESAALRAGLPVPEGVPALITASPALGARGRRRL